MVRRQRCWKCFCRRWRGRDLRLWAIFEAGKLYISIHVDILWGRSTYLPNPSDRAGYDTRSIFKRSLLVWIQSFPSPRLVASPRLKNLLPYYLPIAGGRIIGFMLFPRVLVLCEMQIVDETSRIWTNVAVSISYDDNYYTTGTSLLVEVIFLKECTILFTEPCGKFTWPPHLSLSLSLSFSLFSCVHESEGL